MRRKTIAPLPDTQAAAPLVTAMVDHGRRIVAAADRHARGAGIIPGMTITRARTYAPVLTIIDADPAGDSEGLRRLGLWAARRYSPVVATDPPNGILLDITGCAVLFGSEKALLKDLHRRVAGAGYDVQIAVADTAGAAHAVARQVPAGRPVTIEPGQHGKALALLPIDALRLTPDTVDGLARLGFDRIEQLVAAPRAPIVRRFGPSVHLRLDQALGLRAEPLEPLYPDALPHSRRGLLEPIMTADAMATVIGDLLADVIDQLDRVGLGARRLDCHFHRVDGHLQAIRVGTAMPSRDAPHLAKLLGAKIETIDPGLGIEAMTLVVPLADRMTPDQASCLARAGDAGPDIGPLVDALANRFGRRHLYRTTPHPSIMPERSVACIAPLAAQGGARWPDAVPRPSRMLRSPEPVDVIAMLPDSPPAQFTWRGRRYKVAQADGPERLHGEWWREAGSEAKIALSVRDYFQVETTQGQRYWLFRLGDGSDPASGPMQWFLHGAFA